MSREALSAARLLLESEIYRSSVSRAYYASYCAVAGKLVERRVSFPHNWSNPSHDQLPDLVLNNLPLPLYARFEINKALRRLRKGRKDADYRPKAVIDQKDATKLRRDAAFVLRTPGVQSERTNDNSESQ